ncbi:kinase-like protein [Calocera viscosa TUFC12733]|uniref:Kinase-like protein n=1 Tax=Calocera viscosa (strain TUFC12733) TaxID=1330018 RepID=A0A167PRC2_CALVF|nr:kinase-like protein [Calocera viscosa TUFC12733]
MPPTFPLYTFSLTLTVHLVDASSASHVYERLADVLQSSTNITPYIFGISHRAVDIGAFANIWTASFNGAKVALKTMRIISSSSSTSRINDFLRELHILEQLRHPNVLQLCGVCIHEPYGLALVSPWMEHGNVEAYLRMTPDAHRSSLILDVAQGLSHLHSMQPPVVHGGLRARNILIRPSGEACIAGFSFAHELIEVEESEVSEPKEIAYSSVRWLPPERLFPENYGLTEITSSTCAADIYSLAILMLEMFSGLKPFHEIENHIVVLRMIERGERPSHPGNEASQRGLCDSMWDVMQDCWKERCTERPIISDTVDAVKALVHATGASVASLDADT